MERALYTDEHDAFRGVVKDFIKRVIEPHRERWDEEGGIDRSALQAAGDAGVVGLAGPEQYGGGGQLRDYRFRNVVVEELARAGAGSFASTLSIQDDIVIPYLTNLTNEEQRQRWLPGLVTGRATGAIGMTEPGTGSDLRGIRTTAKAVDGGFVVNGAKTFITCGSYADLVVVVAKTGEGSGPGAFSLLVVEEGMPGFEKNRRLKKVGFHGQDTAELSFTDVFVPAENLIGDEPGQGFYQLMRHLPLERLSIAATAVAFASAAVEQALEYADQRTAFGKAIMDFQNTRFELADVSTEVLVGQAFLDNAIRGWNTGTLTPVEAARVKLWTTEMQGRVVDRSVQLFGGYGYMTEYPIARAYAEARVQRIYGGTSEIMREIIGRELAGRK